MNEWKARRDLLATEPETLEGMLELIRYVDQAGKRQSDEGHYNDWSEMLFANLKEFAAVRAGSVHA